jgi:tryptophan 2,3-dioxygenase
MTSEPPASRPITYRSYLRLPELLDCQTPLSDAHDELLFISIHQASEIWMKLCIHELTSAISCIKRDDVSPALKMLSRVSRIQAQMIQSWEVLATMTPVDYDRMRGKLGTSSGFQSDQYRYLEFLMGNKNAKMLEMFGDEPKLEAKLRAALEAPSLYDEVLRLLARRGLPVPAESLDRDFSETYRASPGVEQCWLQIYGNTDAYWDLYELAEKLVDLEYRFQLWRFGHLKTIERIIGFKRGTGGTSGVAYLAKVIEQVFFPELLTVRTAM